MAESKIDVAQRAQQALKGTANLFNIKDVNTGDHLKTHVAASLSQVQAAMQTPAAVATVEPTVPKLGKP